MTLPFAAQPVHLAAMRFIVRLAGRLLLVAIIFCFLAIAFGFALVFTSLPDVREDLAIPSLAAPVSISLDQQGIPRIRAEGERDAMVALGYLHARDRMFQMDSMRRGVSGRLAEIAGPQALRLDRFTRTLGLVASAEADLAALDAGTRDMLAAYAEGVNALLLQRGRLAAPEFLVLGEPEPWKPVDSLLWGKAMGLYLSGSWRRDLERAGLAATLPADKVEDLWPRDPSPGRPDLAAALPDPRHLVRVLGAVPVFGQDAPLPDTASNAWVVSGAHSTSGAPLLASDPHLGFTAPIIWYLARIDLPNGQFRLGATAPGVPGFVIGRNQDIAWGFTTTHSDTQDVFVERLSGADAYDTPDGPRPFTVREERIAVRGAEQPEILRVRQTLHGPVMSDLDPTLAPDQGFVLSVAMANLAPLDSTASGLLALNRATSVAEARAAAARFSSPPQNLLVADRAGRIAQYLVGRTPIRAAGDGSTPVRGWDGSGDWTGFVPFDAMAHVEDPESGQIANANARPAPPEHPVFLGRDWFGDWRLRRIRQLLAARPKHDAAGFAAMQNDVASLLAQEILPVLRAVPEQPGLAGQAQALLRDWNGTMTADSPQPLIHHAWLRHFKALALEAGGAPAGTPAGPEFLQRVLTDPARGAAWCGAQGCAPLLVRALGLAVAGLDSDYGSDPAKWRWGAAHFARFEHSLLRFVPVLDRLTRLQAETPGDNETLSRGAMRGVGEMPFLHQQGAGLRAVFDLADPEGTLAIIVTGQSGHPLSDNYSNLLETWRRGETLRLTRQPQDEFGSLHLKP